MEDEKQVKGGGERGGGEGGGGEGELKLDTNCPEGRKNPVHPDKSEVLFWAPFLTYKKNTQNKHSVLSIMCIITVTFKWDNPF